jgi:hypothetical protein
MRAHEERSGAELAGEATTNNQLRTLRPVKAFLLYSLFAVLAGDFGSLRLASSRLAGEIFRPGRLLLPPDSRVPILPRVHASAAAPFLLVSSPVRVFSLTAPKCPGSCPYDSGPWQEAIPILTCN